MAPSVWTRCGMTAKTWYISQEAKSLSGRGQGTARCNKTPVCPLRYIAAGPWSPFRGKKGFCARISPMDSKLSTQTGIPCGNVGYLTFRGVLCGGACVAMRSSKKPRPRYSMAHIILEPVLHGLKCLSKARSCASTRVAAQPARLPRRPGPHGRGRVHPGLDRWEIVLLRARKPGVTRRRVLTSIGRRPTPTARQDPPAGKTQMESVKWSLAIGVAGFGHENSRRRL